MTKPHETGTAKPPRDILAEAIEAVKDADTRCVYRDLSVTALSVKAMQESLVELCATVHDPGKRVPASPETQAARAWLHRTAYRTTMALFDRTFQASAAQLVSVALSQGQGRELEAQKAQISTDAIDIADVAATMLAIIHHAKPTGDKPTGDKPDDEVFVNLSAHLMRLHRFLAENIKPRPTAN